MTCRDRGYFTVIAADTENHPTLLRLRIEGMLYDGPVDVLFETEQWKNIFRPPRACLNGTKLGGRS